MPPFYLVIVDNEVVATANGHHAAQEFARIYSLSERGPAFETAKVIYLPGLKLQGIWVKGERHA